ncbi:unnamed protein product [Lathyrus oleraceus]|uniref:Formin-like protein n=1 Tax=Pisum sativum TaxID=3888 RepID=A0A9D5ATH3_PEA|nr:formin-like protein 6 [Pisum sativum]KAI5417920.1 hypothetical protein KIW84_042520 [Pisum sativum]
MNFRTYYYYYYHLNFFFIILLSSFSLTTLKPLPNRRNLHQPFLFPVSSAPPPELYPPPPPDTTPSSPDIPFFNEFPAGTPPPPVENNQNVPSSSYNATIANPTATKPTEPAKKVAIAVSVAFSLFVMFSVVAFFLYKQRTKPSSESDKMKLVGENSQGVLEDSTMAPQQPSSFLYIGTVVEPNGTSVGVANPHKINTIGSRYRPSPELHPLPPLTKSLVVDSHSPPAVSSSSSSDNDESRETELEFHSRQESSSHNLSREESYYTPVSRQSSLANGSPTAPVSVSPVVPFSKRTSPKSRLSGSSPDIRHAMIPSIKQVEKEATLGGPSRRPKFSSPPPAPNLTHLHSNDLRDSLSLPPPPPPPPPPRNFKSPVVSTSSSSASRYQWTQPRSHGEDSASGNSLSVKKVFKEDDEIEMEEGKPKLKPLHWDKVRATSDRATVWDQLKSSSFQLNEDMMETLFGCNSLNSAPKPKEVSINRKPVFASVEQENRVLDPKKSQNIAILLRALNVTRDEVSEALLDGNPEGLGAELLETLVKMAPTKEEEIKLKHYDGDLSKLGPAERFLKAVLDVPLAFKRVEAMLYRANFETEVNYLKKSFQTLEAASEELKNSRLFLKLLEAVLRTGNRMNVGTNRGDAKSFKLDTLLKLADIKGTDGKTTLLHFVVQEIIRSEGTGGESANENVQNQTNSQFNEDEFKKKGLQVVAGLSRDFGNVKKAAGMDSDVLSSYVIKLEMGLDKVRLILQYVKPDMQGNFFNSTEIFMKDAEEKILRIKADEIRALFLVKEVTEYFHGDTTKEEAHPFRIFMIVRDFLNILDQVCKEVGKMQDKTASNSSRSFRIAASASLPVLNRYRARQDTSSDEESLSP